MKKKIIDFLKKNVLYVILILAIIVLIAFGGIKQRQIVKYASDYSKLETLYNNVQTDRDNLLIDRDRLKIVNERIQHEKDSIKGIKENIEKELAQLIIKHEKEIDSLLNIPPDTVFSRLQPIFPNYDNSPLAYPFSGSQICQIYSTAIKYPMLKQEYGLQAKLLSVCNDYNKKYEESEANFKDQVANLSKDLGKCDQQIGFRDKQLDMANKKLKRKNFWNYIYKGTTILFGTIAAVK